VGEVVDTAIGLYRWNWKLLVGTAAAVVVPVQLLGAFLNRTYFSQVSDMVRSLQRGVTPSSPITGTSFGSLGGLLTVLALPFLTVAIAIASASCYIGNPVTPGQAWRRTIRRFWAVLGLGLLRVLIIGFGFFLFMVPGIFLYIRLLVAPVAFVMEEAGPVTALERSWRLTGGHWWRICGVEVLKGVVAWFGYALIETPTVLLGFLTGRAGWLFVGVGGSLLQVFVFPFLVAVTVVAYFDLRIRKEAFDLALGAQRLQSVQAA
jgi:hypothetical protein